MPVINRRQHSGDLRSTALNAGGSTHVRTSSTDSIPSQKTAYWIPSSTIPEPTNKPSLTTLRLRTSPSLHDRYQSSEEEASPSPDDYTSNTDSEGSLSRASPEVPEPASRKASVSSSAASSTYEDAEPELEADTFSDSDEEVDEPLPITFSAAALAIAIPLHYAGRPKLISISALAPMQKRKRPLPASGMTLHPNRRFNPTFTQVELSAKSSYSSIVDLTTSPAPTIAVKGKGRAYQTRSPHYNRSSNQTSIVTPKRTDSLPKHDLQSPATWLPSDEMSLSESEEAESLLHPTFTHPFDAGEEIHFPSEDLDLSLNGGFGNLTSPTPTSYADYDPYALAPPRLSRESSDTSRRAGGLDGRKGSGAYEDGREGWRGLVGRGKGRRLGGKRAKVVV